MKFKNLLFIAVLMTLTFSCTKGPGPGGTSSVKGKVIVEDYNQTFTTLWATYDGADRDVYLRYGDNPTYSDRVKTGPQGDFEFTYLTKGNYSKDSSLEAPSGQISLITNFEITKNKQIVVVPTFTVFE